MTRSLLIYDGRRPWFRAAARALTRETDLVPVGWESAAARAFLEAQFDDRPFAFVLVEAETVHVGSAAVGRLCDRYGLDGRAAALLERLYPPLSGPFGRVVHGRAPADLDGTFPLADAARPHADRLRGTEIPVTE